MKEQFFRKWSIRGSGDKGKSWLKKKGIGKHHLSTKIACIAGVMLVVVFAALIGTTSRMTRNAMKQSAFRELKTLASENGKVIQQTLDEASQVSDNITYYLENSAANRLSQALRPNRCIRARYLIMLPWTATA